MRLKSDGTRCRTGGEVKGKLANGVGSQYSHTASEHGVSSITNTDVHTSAASRRLNWRPHRYKWTHPFRRKTKSGFCACTIRFQTHSTHRNCSNLNSRGVMRSVLFIMNSYPSYSKRNLKSLRSQFFPGEKVFHSHKCLPTRPNFSLNVNLLASVVLSS